MDILYYFLNSLRRLYWFIFRPHTQGVKCLIENDDKYLLVKTSYSGDYWTLPGGGCDYKEAPEQAIKREVVEELGIILTDVVLLGSYESTVEYKRDTVYLFYGKSQEKNFKTNAEIAEASWFPKDMLPQDQSRALKESLRGIDKLQ